MPKWLFYSILTIVIWGIWGIVTKAAADAVPPLQNQVLFTLGLIPPALLCLPAKDLREGTNLKRGFWFGFLTGIFGGVGNIALFAAFNDGGKAAIIYPLTSVYPLVTLLLAWFALKERLNSIQTAGIAVATFAVGMLSMEKGSSFSTLLDLNLSKWLMLSLAAIVCWGIAGVTQKLSSNQVSAPFSFLAYAAAFVPMAAVILLTNKLEWNFPTKSWICAIVGGALMGLGTLTSFGAFRHGGKASIVTPLIALYPVITVVAAVPLFHESVGMREIIGIVIALGAAIALSFEGTLQPTPAHVETKSN